MLLICLSVYDAVKPVHTLVVFPIHRLGNLKREGRSEKLEGVKSVQKNVVRGEKE